MSKETAAVAVIDPYLLDPMVMSGIAVGGFVAGVKEAFQNKAVPETTKYGLSSADFVRAFHVASLDPRTLAIHNVITKTLESSRAFGMNVGTAVKACFKIS